MDLEWLVHGFSNHRLIAGLGIPMLVVWQRRMTTCGKGEGVDNVLVGRWWRMIPNYRVHRSAQFHNNDHRHVVATLKLLLKSGRMVLSQPRLDVVKLKDERVARGLETS